MPTSLRLSKIAQMELSVPLQGTLKVFVWDSLKRSTTHHALIEVSPHTEAKGLERNGSFFLVQDALLDSQQSSEYDGNMPGS